MMAALVVRSGPGHDAEDGGCASAFGMTRYPR